jgi:uncharacterized repeat protein (TIGR03803 family)
MSEPIRSRNLAVGQGAGYFHVQFVLPIVIAGLGLMLAGRATAQTFTTLHIFDPSDGSTTGVQAGLTLSGDTLYGASWNGGSGDNGTVFKVNTDGTRFTSIYSFSPGGGVNPVTGDETNVDGARPLSALILWGNTLYGTAEGGGSGGYGTVFAVNTDGTGFTRLHNFTASNADGVYPFGGLIITSNTLYGTAQYGGSSGNGTVFKVNIDGSGYTTLHSFTGSRDGATPVAGLILSSNILYGTASYGGNFGHGTVFAINTDGTGFRTVYNFGGSSIPQVALISWGNRLYGTAGGGSSGNGTVFAVNTDGTGFTNLHSFTAPSGSSYTNSDGADPRGGLIVFGNTLYGTTFSGGSSGNGTVFAVSTDGTGFSVLHSFGNCGQGPLAGLILSGKSLYGTTFSGDCSVNGTVFSISFTPQLTIVPSAVNVILTWPTNYAGFDYTGYTLQSTTKLASPAWTTNLPAPVVVNGQNTVTNPISGTQQFFRLSQ